MATPTCPWFLLLLLLTFSTLLPDGWSTTWQQDVRVLYLLKASLDPASVTPGSCISSWNFSFDPCDNLFTDRFPCGFECQAIDDSTPGSHRVTGITLDHAGYSGSLATVPFNDVTYLQILDLSGNRFYGPIPESLHGMSHLTRLLLSGNSFNGPIPSSIGSLVSIEEVFLDGNYLAGSIPPSVNSLTNLNRLGLQNNRLTGSFPDLSSLRNLQYLDASNNAFSGELPTGDTLPPSLVQLILRNNSLQGAIPDAIGNLQYLQVLDLFNNQLTGPVPSFFFTNPSMQQLNLGSNRLTYLGSPPITSFLQSQLVALDLSKNLLEGVLPAFLPLMPRLSSLSLENNKFSGMIPLPYAIKAVVPPFGVSQFTRLLLGGNYLMGPIPAPLLWLYKGGASSSSSFSGVVKLDGNCLYRCPFRFFFCQGTIQRPPADCKSF